MKIAFKPSARKELMDLPDRILVKAFKTILDLGKIQDRGDTIRLKVGPAFFVFGSIVTTESCMRLMPPKGNCALSA